MCGVFAIVLAMNWCGADVEQMKDPDPPLAVLLRREDQEVMALSVLLSQQPGRVVSPEIAQVEWDGVQRLQSALRQLQEAREAVRRAVTRGQFLEASGEVPIREAQYEASKLELEGIRGLIRQRYPVVGNPATKPVK